MQKGKQPSRRPAGCLLPSLRPPGLPPAGRSPRHGPLVGRTEPGTLFKHGTAAGLGRGQLPLSFRSTPHTEDSAQPGPLTNPTARLPGCSRYCVYRNQGRRNQSDRSGNRSTLLRANVFAIYKKFPAWPFV